MVSPSLMIDRNSTSLIETELVWEAYHECVKKGSIGSK
jgi:hypothetical protein